MKILYPDTPPLVLPFQDGIGFILVRKYNYRGDPVS